MSNLTAEVLAELRIDHKNMSLMIGLLEREVNQIYDGQEPDYDLIADIMHYMTVYPDAIHHPKEDRLYAELRAIRPDLSVGFEKISLDHRQIAEQSIALRDKFLSITAGSPVRRTQVVGDSLRYINTLREHMRWEETDLFRRVEELIRGGHETIGAAILNSRADPVFGASIEHNFHRLAESIRESAANG